MGHFIKNIKMINKLITVFDWRVIACFYVTDIVIIIMMPAKVSTKRPSFVLSVTAESNDSSPVPSSPPSTGNLNCYILSG